MYTKKLKHFSPYGFFIIAISTGIFSACSTNLVSEQGSDHSVELHKWLLPDTPPFPKDNEPTKARVELGKMLFFDPRISRDQNMSCATCHNPSLGWSDGLAKGRGFKSTMLGRASPSIVNTAYNTIQMWDGRKKDLEDQAMGPLEAGVEMNTNFETFFTWIRNNDGYVTAYEKAYPGLGITKETTAKAIASFERTVISNNSPFDQWIKGDSSAMTEQQVRGFNLFKDENKANCAVCHDAPNFTDNGMHNIGLASFGDKKPDLGRFDQKPLRLMKGAFKTPTLRDVALSAPYFHDGSARTLMQVVEHYAKGGFVKTNLSPNLKEITLTQQDKEDLVAFMQALTSEHVAITFPLLP
ncbi:MAG: cytochrome-c peroxidase [Methylococcaceae bacterium]